MEYSPKGASALYGAARSITVTTPKTMTMTASGCVRRQSRVSASAMHRITATGRHVTSGRRSPSRSAESVRTPTSAQSRQTRIGGFGAAGSSQSESRPLRTTPEG